MLWSVAAARRRPSPHVAARRRPGFVGSPPWVPMVAALGSYGLFACLLVMLACLFALLCFALLYLLICFYRLFGLLASVASNTPFRVHALVSFHISLIQFNFLPSPSVASSVAVASRVASRVALPSSPPVACRRLSPPVWPSSPVASHRLPSPVPIKIYIY